MMTPGLRHNGRFLYAAIPAGSSPVPVWGISIVADSAHSRRSIAELADGARGTMLTVQTALGFTLTLVTIHLMPHFCGPVGWLFAFMPLARAGCRRHCDGAVAGRIPAPCGSPADAADRQRLRSIA